MEEIFKIVLTSAFTIIGAVLIFSITKILELVYIKPFFNFKDKLVKTNTNLNFHKNILTNAFNRGEINDVFFEKIMKAQETVRADWASLKSAHAITPKLFKNRKKVFSSEEMKKIEENLLYLSNAPIIRSNQMQRPDDCVERLEKVNEIEKISKKYL
jgi:hypothetical protein